MLTGTENTYKALLNTEMIAGILAECGQTVQTPNCILGIAAGQSKATISHLVANIQVLPGTFNVPGFGSVVGIGLIL